MTFRDLVYAAVTASSMALLSSAIESIFDVTSNVLLYYTHKKASNLDVDKWPVGGSRLVTIGNIAYGMYRTSGACRSLTTALYRYSVRL